MEEKYKGKSDDECLAIFRQEIMDHNKLNIPLGKEFRFPTERKPEENDCIVQGCQNKVNETWDNNVLCEEHQLLMIHWFYELDGNQYVPEVWDFDSGKKLPKPEHSDVNMEAYRKRYCDWILSLSKEDYRSILLNSIR